jgi:hypothetical protein
MADRIRRGSARAVLVLGALAPLLAGPALATEIGFDDLEVGQSVSSLLVPGVSISSGTVVDDVQLAALVFGYPGPFATSGDRGIVNITDSAILFDFSVPIQRFEIDVLSLPNATDDLLPVLLQAYAGDTPTDSVISTGSASAETLSIWDPNGTITRIVLFPRVPCAWIACDEPADISDVYLDVPSSFFADTLRTIVPEPGTLFLLGVGVIGLAAGRRRRGALSKVLGGGLVLLLTLFVSGCIPIEVRIETPSNGTRITLPPGDPSALLPVKIQLGEALDPGGSVRVTLLAGGDATSGTFSNRSGDFSVIDAEALGEIEAGDLSEGSNTLFVGVDRDGDQIVDVIVTSTFHIEFGSGHSIARIWNEVLLDAIRVDTPRPTVHARNLFHLSAVMWDCWVAYDDVTNAVPYLFSDPQVAVDKNAARAACISHAAYVLLKYRFQGSIGAATTLPALDATMDALGYDKNFVAAQGDPSPEAVGGRFGVLMYAHGLNDGANEQFDYDDPVYTPVNTGLIFKLPGTGASINNPNRWTPLTFDFACFQNQIPVPVGAETQVFVGSHWEDVTPFALTRPDPSVPYLDPGLPPLAVAWNGGIVGPGDLQFKQEMLDVVRYSSRLNPDDAPMINTSPGVVGGNSLAGLAAGIFDGTGHPLNPSTGLPYPANWVNEADFGRVVAEFWADGPDSETPPGHWNTLTHAVFEDPEAVDRIGGTGPLIDDLERDVKVLFALNGAVHDAAIAAWTSKAVYDYGRPIAGIRWLSEQGQSQDPSLPSYSVHGMLLEPGLVEIITAESSAAGERHEHLADHVGELAANVWPGEPNREQPAQCGEDPPEPDPELEIPPYSGREWILAEAWTTYQRRTFVTPPFAAYVSGHSTFSRAAAVVLHRFTGSPYFPGGYGEFVAPQNEFLVFENGPNQTVKMVWATYYDAADEAGISRLWGGIHVPADDFRGRVMGDAIGHAAYDLAEQYWNGTVAP